MGMSNRKFLLLKSSYQKNVPDSEFYIRLWNKFLREVVKESLLGSLKTKLVKQSIGKYMPGNNLVKVPLGHE